MLTKLFELHFDLNESFMVTHHISVWSEHVYVLITSDYDYGAVMAASRDYMLAKYISCQK